MFPKLIDEVGNRVCRMCKGKLPKGRTSWCSDECNNDAMIMCYPSFARSAVYKRDKGVCALCHTDAHRLEMRFYHWKKYIVKKAGGGKANEFEHRLKKRGWRIGGSWWDADHIHPVVKGGGGCGLENYRTLCVLCHKKETRELARQRSLDRKYLQGKFMQPELF